MRHSINVLVCGLLLTGGVYAQRLRTTTPTTIESTVVTVESDNPANQGYTRKREFNGDNNPTYIGVALSNNKEYEWGIGYGLTSIVDAANTATVTTSANHGLTSLCRVYVDGASDTDLNSASTGYIITVTGATTFTFTSASVTDATYNTTPLRFWSRCPRSNDTVWKIYQHTYTSTNPTGTVWAEGDGSKFNYAWDSRASYAYY